MVGLVDDCVDICHRSNYQPNLSWPAGSYEEEYGVWFHLAQQTFREWTAQEQQHTTWNCIEKESIWLLRVWVSGCLEYKYGLSVCGYSNGMAVYSKHALLVRSETEGFTGHMGKNTFVSLLHNRKMKKKKKEDTPGFFSL